MRPNHRHLGAAATVLAIAFVATVAAAAAVFTGPGTDWYDANNWASGVLPTSDDTLVIGTAAYPDTDCVLGSGAAVVYGLEFARGGSGSLTIAEGASLESFAGWFIVGYSGGDDMMATLTVNGSLVQNGYGNTNIAPGTDVTMTIGENGSFTTETWTVIGRGYGSAMGDDHHDTYIYQNGGVFTSNYMSNTSVELYQDSTHTMLYKMSGGTINVPNGGWWNLGGTFEVAGQVQINTYMQFISGWFGDVTLKFSGTDPLFTSPQAADFGDPNVRTLTYVDVSELTLSTPNTWVSVMDCPEILNPDNVALLPGTAPEWSMQYDAASGDLQLKYAGGPIMGDVHLSGLVDDNLSLLLANWNAGTTWGTGDLNASGNVDDDDLSLLLANWGAGSSPVPEAVPEPATMALLTVGGLGVLLRKRR